MFPSKYNPHPSIPAGEEKATKKDPPKGRNPSTTREPTQRKAQT